MPDCCGGLRVRAAAGRCAAGGCATTGRCGSVPGRRAQRSPAGAASSPAAALGAAPGSLTFAVIGDNGTGDTAQYDTGRQLFAAYQRQAFPLVIMVGDNIYGSERPQDFVKKFEAPYRPLLDAGVKFYASLGNHDSREQRYYKPYNMEGKLYYSLKAPEQDVRFFALDSTYLDKPQARMAGERAERVERGLEDSRSFITRRTRRAAGMGQTFASARPWSRCSSSTGSPWSLPATTTSTSAPGRNKGSPIS